MGLAGVRAWCRRPLLTQPGLMRSAAQQVHSPVARDAHQPPWNATSFGLVGVPAVPGAQKCVLKDLPSELWVADDPERKGKDEPSVTPVERLEGCFVPEPHPPEEL